MERFRKLLAPALAEGRAFWGSELLEDETPATEERVRWIVDSAFSNPALQLEIDRFIDVCGQIDTTSIESIYLDAAVKFYLASPAMHELFAQWHAQLPPTGVIVHYGTSSGTESAWLLHKAPERTVLQVDGNDAAFGSGQKKLVRISRGRATDYATVKRDPWRPNVLNNRDFADGAIIHRVPPFPLENREQMLERAFVELKPGAHLTLAEPNLESGSDPKGLADFVYLVGRCSASEPSQMTEFDLALVARVKQRCLEEAGFHLFQAQMASEFLSYSRAIATAERVGFRVISSAPALHGRVHQLVLEKPAAGRPQEPLHRPVRTLSDEFTTELVPRQLEPRHDAICA